MQVGIVGLGAIGKAIVPHLLKAGLRTVIWNRTPEAGDVLVARGAIRADNVGDAFRSDVVLSLLFDDDAVRSVILESNVLTSARPGMVHVCMSTISTAAARDLAAAHARCGVAYVAGPFLGRPEAAAAAALNILTAGEPADLDRVEPVLSLLGRTWRMGADPQIGHLAKIAANFMLGSAIEAMEESAVLMSARGGDPAALLVMLSETLFAAPFYRQMAPAIGAGAFVRSPEMLKIMLKDLGLAAAEGADAGAELPFADVMLDRLKRGDD
jgi:3-hydroxyisobutyrate dehydrogenase-like beta-hydroxyacid dehydrogenase